MDIATITFLILVIIGVLSFFLYVVWGDKIFEFNIDKGWMYTVKVGGKDKGIKNELYKERSKKESLKDVPCPWLLERYYHRTLGVVIGVAALWILLGPRLRLLYNDPIFNNLSWPGLVLFMIAFLGLNGRLPTIAHSVQDWFKRS